MLVKQFEEDFVTKHLWKEKLIALVRWSKHASQHAVPKHILLSRECRSKIKLDVGHNAIFFSCKKCSNQGEIKLMFKANDKNDKASELIGTTEYEDDALKITVKILKKCIAKRI